MSVKADASGRRSVQVEIEVQGTPEEVWQAIATRPGISSWFVPAQVEERAGRPVAISLDFGPGMDGRAEVTAWDPPRGFAKQSCGWMRGSPPIAEEWTVEARAGGSCVVRIVHSLFASSDDWDDQLEGASGALVGFLRTLQLYLRHFRGQPAAMMQVMTPAGTTEGEAWQRLTAALGMHGAQVGEHRAAPAGEPRLAGVVEHYTESPYDALLTLDQPAPGVGALGVFTFPGGDTMVAMSFYLYGDQAEATAARETAVWQGWLEQHYPATSPAEA